MSQWKPIETAPKEKGVRILTYGRTRGSWGYTEPEEGYAISYWWNKFWISNCPEDFDPIYWMELPKPPPNFTVED